MRIKQLEEQLAQMEEALHKRHPDSLAALIRAANQNSPREAELEARVAGLEKVNPSGASPFEVFFWCGRGVGKTGKVLEGGMIPLGLQHCIAPVHTRESGAPTPRLLVAQELEQERKSAALQLRGLKQRFEALKAQFAMSLDQVRGTRGATRHKRGKHLPLAWVRPVLSLDCLVSVADTATGP